MMALMMTHGESFGQVSKQLTTPASLRNTADRSSTSITSSFSPTISMITCGKTEWNSLTRVVNKFSWHGYKIHEQNTHTHTFTAHMAGNNWKTLITVLWHKVIYNAGCNFVPCIYTHTAQTSTSQCTTNHKLMDQDQPATVKCEWLCWPAATVVRSLLYVPLKLLFFSFTIILSTLFLHNKNSNTYLLDLEMRSACLFDRCRCSAAHAGIAMWPTVLLPWSNLMINNYY